MNKKNKILVGCLALLLALSVGYALFSETITINGTATAKGSFEITGTCEGGYSKELVNAGIFSSTEEGQGDYSSDTCSVDGNSVSFSAELNAPGAARAFTIKLTNTGTIPATIDFDKVDHNYITNEVIKICPLLENGTASTNCTDRMIYVSNELGYEMPAISNGYEVDSVALELNGITCNHWTGECGDVRGLNPGDSIYYEVIVFWPSSYASGYDYGFKNSYSFDVPVIQLAN